LIGLVLLTVCPVKLIGLAETVKFTDAVPVNFAAVFSIADQEIVKERHFNYIKNSFGLSIFFKQRQGLM
jgi:hypothetical protein